MLIELFRVEVESIGQDVARLDVFLDLGHKLCHLLCGGVVADGELDADLHLVSPPLS